MARIEKKRERRNSVHERGWITLEGGFAARACTVLDLSASGAKLALDTAEPVSASMKLALSRDARRGRPCKLVWRRGRTLGVRFTP